MSESDNTQEEISLEEIFSGEIDPPVDENSIPEYEHYFLPPMDRFILNNLAPIGVQEVKKLKEKMIVRSLFLSFSSLNYGNTIFQKTTNNDNLFVRGIHKHTIYDFELAKRYGKARN